MKLNLLACLMTVILMVSCNGNEIFFQYKSIPSTGWNKDSLYTFNVAIDDTLASYNVFINVRNRGNYSYQNLWLFTQQLSPDTVLTRDTIECYLADQRGKWLGTGLSSLHEVAVICQQNAHFSRKGTYQYKIVQGMRDTVLTGINDIGLRVEKVK